ncbi:MAG: hypothetical protein ABSF62_23565 [Bryobacteraceae bacterium]|jgi:hypothetical protein
MIWRSVALLGLLAGAAAGWAQAPTPEQTGAALEMSRNVALAYARALPDFICTQLVHRYVDVTHRHIDPNDSGTWRALDTLTIKLSYFDQREDHKVVLVDGKPSEKSYVDLGGATTVGEFGLILQQIFEPASQAIFTWEKWARVGNRRAAIYLYQVGASHSRYSLNFLASAGLTQARVGYHGMVEVDRETGDVRRLTYIADTIPKTYPIYSATTTVNYDFADVGGKPYLLPASSETEMLSLELWARNHTEYREYRKFSADSTIRFGEGK